MTRATFTIPATEPGQDPAALWALQNVLLAEAEACFGPRDASKKIYQPVFGQGKPHMINTPDMDGAFAALSPTAKKWWTAAIYELAHETVHMLNPVAGYTNFLEEGVAELFSQEMLKKHGGGIAHAAVGDYAKAAGLVRQLSDPFAQAVKEMRAGARPLSSITAEDITRHCPAVPETVARQLASVCKPL